MQLYGTTTSPYVRKVRIVLHEKQIECDFISEGPSDPAGNVAARNPLGKIPVLVRDDGGSLFDSIVIAEYLDSLSGTPLCPARGEARWTVLRWHALAQGMMDATVTRLMETRRPPDKQMAEAITKQELKVHAALRFAAEQLPTGKAYLVDDRFSMADIAFGAALAYLDLRFQFPWRDQHRGLARWFGYICERPSFVATAPPAA